MDFEPVDNEGEDQELINVASMVDVVFILLAFFVLSTQFLGTEKDVNVSYQQLTDSSGSATDDLPPSIPIRLKADGRGGVLIAIGENMVTEGGFEAITATLTQINMPDIPVAIAADPELSVEVVAQAMDAVLGSPMKNLALGKLKVK